MNRKQFRGLQVTIRRYYRAYGGWQAIFGSPLFWLSLLLTLISYSYWLTPRWVSFAQELLPSLLGFSLGTYAILFSLLTNRIKRALRELKDQSTQSTYLDGVNATFLHYILVQVLALLWAFVYDGSALRDLFELLSDEFALAMPIFSVLAGVGSFIGMLLLLYSLTLIVGAALAVYRLANIVDPVD